MTDDTYLDDPRAPQDPEVAALERVLGSLRLGSTAPPERVLGVAPGPRPRRLLWIALPLLAAAAAVWLWFGSEDGLRPGAPTRTFVTSQSQQSTPLATPLVIPLGDLATITLDPGSELEFLHWRSDQARFRLLRGGLTARVQPPPAVQPGFFVVDTPRGSVVDQGCQYRLSVKPDGSARVLVTEGAVTFADLASAAGVREVFVPAGASAGMSAAGVLGTPLFLDGAPDLRRLVRLYDDHHDDPDAARRLDIVRKLVSTCSRPRDTLPLWHLLQDRDPTVHKIAIEALFELAGAPDGSARLQRRFTAEQWLDFLRVAAWQAGG